MFDLAAFAKAASGDERGSDGRLERENSNDECEPTGKNSADAHLLAVVETALEQIRKLAKECKIEESSDNAKYFVDSLNAVRETLKS